jgi:hypothetical protein
MVLRKPRPPNPELERLLEERIDLNVRSVLLREAVKPDLAELNRVTTKLEAVEARITRLLHHPNRWNRTS